MRIKETKSSKAIDNTYGVRDSEEDIRTTGEREILANTPTGSRLLLFMGRKQ